MFHVVFSYKICGRSLPVSGMCQIEKNDADDADESGPADEDCLGGLLDLAECPIPSAVTDALRHLDRCVVRRGHNRTFTVLVTVSLTIFIF